MPAPDYGVALRNQGFQPDAQWTLAPFELHNLQMVEKDKFSTMCNIVDQGIVARGQEFAVSIDFGRDKLEQLLKSIPANKADAIRSYAARNPNPPWVIQLPLPIPVVVTVRLGEAITNDMEEYIPFVAESFESASWLQ